MQIQKYSKRWSRALCCLNLFVLLVNHSDVDHDGLWVGSEQVFPHVENDALERSGNGQSVLGIVLVSLLIIFLNNDIPVDDSWLDGTAQVDQVLSAL